MNDMELKYGVDLTPNLYLGIVKELRYVRETILNGLFVKFYNDSVPKRKQKRLLSELNKSQYQLIIAIQQLENELYRQYPKTKFPPTEDVYPPLSLKEIEEILK